MTVQELLAQLENELEDNNENPMIAHWVLQHYYGLNSNLELTKLLTNKATKIKYCFDAIKRYINGEPLARILGKTQFYYQEFLVNDNVFCPRLETEILVDNVIKLCKSKTNLKILDLCCGTGVIGISLKLALDKQTKVSVADINKNAVINAVINAQQHNCEIIAYHSNFFNNIPQQGFDVIVCNPPYIDMNEKIGINVEKFDPQNALFADDNGILAYKEIIDNAKRYLKSKYLLAFEIGSNQAKIVSSLLKKLEPNLTIEIIQDYNKRDRVIIAKKDF